MELVSINELTMVLLYELTKLTLVYLCSDARDVHCHSNLEHSTHVIVEHSVNFSIYVHVLVFCGCSLKLISKILTSLYGNTTGFFWRSRQDSLPYRNHFASERSLHSLLLSWRISKSSSNCFRRRWMSSADRLKLSLQPSPRGWTVPLLKSVFLCSRHSTPLRSSGLTTGRAFKPSWQLTLSQATEWPRYFSLTRPRLRTNC